MQHGLAETLMAYGADLAELEHLQLHPNPDKLAKLLTIVPQRHRQFIHDLPAVLEHPDIFVVHAMWDVDTSDTPPTSAPNCAPMPVCGTRSSGAASVASKSSAPSGGRAPDISGIRRS